MCLLTYFPPFAEVRTDRLECGARCNPHGHGFAIVTADGEVFVDHAMTPAALIEKFAGLRRQYPDSHALFHSRITTHGTTGLSNCHPFIVSGPRGGQTILAHNGILPRDCQPRGKDTRSDTRILAESLLWKRWRRHRLPSLGSAKPRFTSRWLDSPEVRASIETWLGTGSKVLVLTTNPRLSRTAYLFNGQLGDWVDGVWYSNSSYETWRPSSYVSLPTTSYRYESGSFVPIANGGSWWEEWPTETRALTAGDDYPTRNGDVYKGRIWNPRQSYLHHFRDSSCGICEGHAISRHDYICDTCGVCWICNEYFTDCFAGDNCGSNGLIRRPFDAAYGYEWPGAVKSAKDSAAVFELEGEQ